MDCKYCFLTEESKHNSKAFDRWDELLKFLKTVPLGEQVSINLSSGELSMQPELIRTAYEKLKKIERYKDTKLVFGMYTNGTNIDEILNLLDEGILDSRYTSMSWDGVTNTLGRTPIDIRRYKDSYFNNAVKKIGYSKHGDEFVIRSALTFDLLENIEFTLYHLYESGCANWEYYYLIDNDDYRKQSFQTLFRKALQYMYKYKKLGLNIYNLSSMDKYYSGDGSNKGLWCKCLTDSMDISLDGKVLPCGSYASNYKYAFPHPEIFDDISKPFDEKKLRQISCDNCLECTTCDYAHCRNKHCVECSRMVHYRNGNSFDFKSKQPCQLRDIEREEYLRRS